MTDNEANQIRLLANGIMRKLYLAGQREQLKILSMYAIRAIEEIDKEKVGLNGQEKRRD